MNTFKNTKRNNPVSKWANELNREFSKEEICGQKKKMKKNCQHPQAPGEYKLKLLWYSISPHLHWLSLRKQMTTDTGQGVGKEEPFSTAGGGG